MPRFTVINEPAQFQWTDVHAIQQTILYVGKVYNSSSSYIDTLLRSCNVSDSHTREDRVDDKCSWSSFLMHAAHQISNDVLTFIEAIYSYMRAQLSVYSVVLLASAMCILILERALVCYRVRRLLEMHKKLM